MIHPELHYASIEELYLDLKNPRLGRQYTREDMSQEKILELMEDWALDELSASFIESGFWVHEALLVVREEVQGQLRLVVVEGNRRVAALKLLFAAKEGRFASKRWRSFADSDTSKVDRNRIPYIVADTRDDILAYLGFRHVTGIKEWNPAEKAEFIARMIDEQGLSYEQVRRKIGSKTPAVRQHYISYRILLQMEELPEDIELRNVEARFSVLYLSLRTSGVQSYLQIDVQAEPEKAKLPVPPDKLNHLAKFALWLFGNDRQPPLITDSRLVDDFGTVLESPQAIEYLENVPRPLFETAYRLAGGDEREIIRLIERASFDIQQALSTAHRHTDSDLLQKAVKDLGKDALQLLRIFPEVYRQLIEPNE